MLLPLILALQGPSISIPCATCSFPEIAQLLSTAGSRVEVSGALRERGALLCLKDRPRGEAIEIVCESFDLKAVKVAKNGIRLEPDPEVAQREAEWRSALLVILNRRWAIQEEHFMPMLKMNDEQLNAVLQLPNNKIDPLSGDARLAAWILRHGGAVSQAASLYADSISAEFQPAFLTTTTQRDEAHAKLNPDLVRKVQVQMGSQGPIREPVTLTREMTHKSGQLQIGAGVSATDRSGRSISLPYPNAVLQFADTGLPGIRHLFESLAHPFKEAGIPGLGHGAEVWIKGEEAVTDNELKDPALSEETPYPGGDATLSGMMQRWSTKHRQEVAMELSPLDEQLVDGDNVSHRPGSMSPSRFFEKDQDWGLDSARGLLIVRDRMAFLDHVCPSPNAEIATYIRNNYSRVGVAASLDTIDQDDDLPEINALLPLIRLRLAPGHSPAFWFGWGGYHGLTEGSVLHGDLRLWPHLPEEALEQIRSQPEGALTIALTRFEGDAVEEYATEIANSDNVDADLRDLKDASLQIRWKRRRKGETAVRVDTLGFRDSFDLGFATAVFQVKNP